MNSTDSANYSMVHVYKTLKHDMVSLSLLTYE